MDIPFSLLPARLALATGFAYTPWFYRAPAGVTPEHLVNPNFWVHLTARLKVNDRIEAVGDDFDIEMRVVGVDPLGHYAVMRVLRCWPEGLLPIGNTVSGADGPTIVTTDPDGYRWERDPVQGWRVLRGRDLLASGLPNEAEAIAKVAELKAPKQKAG